MNKTEWDTNVKTCRCMHRAISEGLFVCIEPNNIKKRNLHACTEDLCPLNNYKISGEHVESCSNCRFESGQTCRRHPPSVIVSGRAEHRYIRQSEWCGEWKAKEVCNG